MGWRGPNWPATWRDDRSLTESGLDAAEPVVKTEAEGRKAASHIYSETLSSMAAASTCVLARVSSGHGEQGTQRAA